MITLKEIGLPFSFPPASQERSMVMLQAHIHTNFDIYLSSLTPVFIYRRYKIIVTHLSISYQHSISNDNFVFIYAFVS